jgi:hypothetical protein
MQITMAHFLRPYGFSIECTLFQCHNCIVKSSIWKKNNGLRLPTWIRIFVKGWNSINMHESYSNGFLKCTYGL